MPATLDPTETQLVAGLAHDVLARTAPGELALFPVTSAAYFRDPQAVTARRAGGDSALGFGTETMVAMAPIALAVSTEVVRWLMGELRTALKTQGAAAIDRAMKRLFGKLVPDDGATKQGGAPAAPSLTPRQLADIRERAISRARQLGLSVPKAEQMADAVVAAVATTGA